MWIFLGIVLFLLLIISVALLLPILLIITTEKNSETKVKFKVLFKTFELDSDSDSSILDTIKGLLKKDKPEEGNSKTEAVKKGFFDSLNEKFTLITSILKEVADLPKSCKVKKLKLHVICAEEDAAKTAINYGRCCAVAYPFLGFIHSIMKVRKKGLDVNITCDYDKKQSDYSLEIVIAIKSFRILVTLLRIAANKSKSDQN